MKRSLAALCALIVLVFTGAIAVAAEPPALTGRVVDQANVIDAQEEVQLDQMLSAFEAKSTDQVVVATIASLDGEAIEPYANRLFREWKLGQAGENNGVLLIVAPNDRKVRIEVGYGLEGTLTDLQSSLIIQNVLIPAFRSGNFGQGIVAATDDIIKVLDGNAADVEARYKRNAPSSESSGMPVIGVLFVIIWCAIFFGSFAIVLLVPRFGRKIGPNKYVWRGITFTVGSGGGGGGRSGWSGGGGFSGGSGGGGFSGGGGSSGGGGASGSW